MTYRIITIHNKLFRKPKYAYVYLILKKLSTYKVFFVFLWIIPVSFCYPELKATKEAPEALEAENVTSVALISCV